MLNSRCGRGQLFTVDLVIASMLSLIMIMLTFEISNELLIVDSRSTQWIDLTYEANSAMQQLLYGNSKPHDYVRYNITDVSYFSLTSSRGVLDRDKVEYFVNADYNTTREVMGLSTADYYFEVHNIVEGTPYYSCGVSPPASSTKYVVKRPALLDGEVVEVTLIAWSD